MRRRTAAVLTAALWALTGGGAARAQADYGPKQDGRLSFGIGAFRAGDGVTRSGVSDVWTLLSADYRLRPSHPSRAVDLSAFVDYAAGVRRERADRRDEFFEYSRSFAAAGLAARLNLLPRRDARSPSLHLTAAGGPFYLQRERAIVFPSWDWDDEDGEDRETLSRRGVVNLGYKLGAGLRFGRGYFLEATYFHMGRLGGARYDGVSAQFGASF